MFCACFLWGSAFACVKIGYEWFNVDKSNIASLMLFAGIRYILAGLLLFIPGIIFKKDDYKLNFLKTKSIAINSIFQVLGQYSFYYIGIATTKGTSAAIINSTTVFISIFLASFLFRTEKYNLKKFISSLMAILSVIVLNLQKDFTFSFRIQSEGFILFSCTCASIAICLQKRLTKSITPSALCSYSFLFGGIIFLIVGIVFGGHIKIDSLKSVLLLFYLAFISSAAFTIQGTLLKYNDVSSISIYRIMNPIIGVIVSSLALKNENKNLFNINTFSSLLIMIAAILLLKFPIKNKSN